jgi:hypothetical protein
MNTAEVLALRQALWANGYRPVAIWSPGAENAEITTPHRPRQMSSPVNG